MMRNRLLLFLLLALAACSNDVETLFANHRAFLRFAPITAAAPLNTALNNPGQWCTITFDATHYHFAALNTPTISYPRTALEAYGQPRAIAGFIVGTPQFPTTTGNFEQVAYDLVCPSCYESAYIERSLQFDADNHEHASCSRCRRTYNLGNGSPISVPKDTQTNPRLYRYRLSFNSTTGVFVIQN